MILPTNMVAIRPDADITFDRTGLERQDFADKHLLKAVTGVVVGVCDRLFFAEDGARPEAAQMSMPWDVPIEIHVGDRVVFSHLASVDKDAQIDGMYIMPYDQVLARIDPPNAEYPLYPLNGYLLIEPETDEHTVAKFVVNKDDVASWSCGRVVAEGCLVEKYSRWKYPDANVPLLGHVVSYPTKRAIRLEGDDTKQFGAGRWSLYRLHRRHIKLILV